MDQLLLLVCSGRRIICHRHVFSCKIPFNLSTDIITPNYPNQSPLQLQQKTTMKLQLFLLEKLLLLLFCLQTLLTFQDHQKQYFWLLSILLFIVSYIYSGARPYTPIFFIIALFDHFEMNLLQIVTIAVLALLIIYFRFYQIQIVDKGSFNVGYKYYRQNGYQLSIFYPTLEDGRHSTWIPHESYPRDLYDIQYVDPTIFRAPFRIFYFVVSFLFKVKMPVIGNAKLHSLDGKFKVILFSHGLGSNSNNYSSICGNWASNGYIVISVQHSNDNIRIQFTKELLQQPEILLKKLYKGRNSDIIHRSTQFNRVFDQILSKNLLSTILKTAEPISIEEIYFSGQSFGAATVLEAMSELLSKNHQRLSIIKGLICLDAWFFPLSQSTYSNLRNQNILLINTDTFFTQIPSFYAMQQKMRRIKQNNQQTLKAFMIKSTDHLCTSDYVFVFGTMFKLLKIVQKQQQAVDVIKLHILMVRLFMQGKNSEEMLQMTNREAKNWKLMEKDIYAIKEWRYGETKQEGN